MHPTHALICSWTHSNERIRAILTAGRIVANPIHIGNILHTMKAAPTGSLLLIASVQHGGLSLASAMQLLDSSIEQSDRIPLLLFDHEDSINAAREALRLKVADYLRLSLPNEVIVERLQRLANSTLPIEDVFPAAEQPDAPVEENKLRWDASIAAIFSGGTWLQLSPVEWRLFEALLQRRGDTVTSFDLITGPLGRSEENPTTSSLLRLHLSRLRNKVKEHGLMGLNIVTVRGHGYMLL